MAVVLKRVNNENRDEIKTSYEDSFPVEEMVPYIKGMGKPLLQR